MTEYLWDTKHAIVKKQSNKDAYDGEGGKRSLTSILIPQRYLFGYIWVVVSYEQPDVVDFL